MLLKRLYKIKFKLSLDLYDAIKTFKTKLLLKLYEALDINEYMETFKLRNE